jgi:hypothetical protein
MNITCNAFNVPPNYAHSPPAKHSSDAHINFMISGSVYSEELKARNQLITEYEQTIHAQEREIAKLKGIEKEWEESLAPGKDDDYIDEHTFGSN